MAVWIFAGLASQAKYYTGHQVFFFFSDIPLNSIFNHCSDMHAHSSFLSYHIHVHLYLAKQKCIELIKIVCFLNSLSFQMETDA